MPSENEHCCSAEEVRALNQGYEYVSLAKCILDEMLELVRQAMINANDYLIWMILYQESRFDEEMSVAISYTELSRKSGLSRTTVINAIKKLCKLNFLDVIKNFCGRAGEYLRNQIRVCLPKHFIEHVKESLTPRKSSSSSELCTGVVQKSDQGWSKNQTVYIRKNNNENKKHSSVAVDNSKINCSPYVPSDKRNDLNAVMSHFSSKIAKLAKEKQWSSPKKDIEDAKSALIKGRYGTDLFHRASIILKLVRTDKWKTKAEPEKEIRTKVRQRCEAGEYMNSLLEMA